MDPINKGIYEFADFRLEVSEQVLSRDGETIQLTPKAFDLLVVLVQNPKHLLTKDELIRALWADSFVEDANLNVTISALRRALGEKPSENKFIETVPRRGYRFVADVREVSGVADIKSAPYSPGDSAPDAKTVAVTEPVKICPNCKSVYYDATLRFCLNDGAVLTENGADLTESVGGGVSGPFGGVNWQNKKWPLAAVGLLVIALTGFGVWNFVGRSNSVSSTADVTTLAVLPFKPITESQSDPALEMGMADTLITKLGKLQQITVRPTSSVSKYMGQAINSLDAGKELKVDTVLEGKIQRADNKIRVTVQLMKVSDGSVIWADSFDDFFTNIFAVQDSISEKMISSLALKLSGKEQELLVKRPTENTEAYALYLQGRYHHEQISEEGSRKAIEYYEAAQKKDPGFALAYAWSIGAYFHMMVIDENRDENIRKARFAATKAVELDPNLSEAHEALAQIYTVLDLNWVEAENEYRRSLELDPRNSDAHHSYSSFLSMFPGRADQAVEEAKLARQLNPVTIYIQIQIPVNLSRAGRLDEAIEEAKKTIEMWPEHPSAYGLLASFYIRKGLADEAEKLLNKFTELKKTPSKLTTAQLQFLRGNRAEGEKLLREQIAQYKPGGNCLPFAKSYAALGEKEKALELLECAFERRETYSFYMAVDPDWDMVRADPRFQAILRRMKLVEAK